MDFPLTRGRGHVVNIGATVAEHADSASPSVLAALTKGGLMAATRSLAIECASAGLRVNAVAPGVIQTPMHPAEDFAAFGDRMPPLGRIGQVSDVVGAILYLESAPWVTGEMLAFLEGRVLVLPCGSPPSLVLVLVCQPPGARNCPTTLPGSLPDGHGGETRRSGRRVDIL